MCLIDKKKVRVAEENIPIWKVVLKKKDGNYYSPFLFENRLWRVNSTDFKLMETSFLNPLYQEYGRGYFHAFLTEEHARYWLPKIACITNYRCFEFGGHFEVVSGYIPEGTRYAKEDREICAHKMVLNI